MWAACEAAHGRLSYLEPKLIAGWLAANCPFGEEVEGLMQRGFERAAARDPERLWRLVVRHHQQHTLQEHWQII